MRLRKYVVTENVTETVPVAARRVRLEREPITEANVGRAMEGPAISEEEHEVALHEERPVVEKEAVPVERVRLGKEQVTDEETVTEEVRKERIEAEGESRTVAEHHRPRRRGPPTGQGGHGADMYCSGWHDDPVSIRVQPTAQVDESGHHRRRQQVWQLAQIREDALLGSDCVIGRGAYVGTGVRIGDNCKVQNYALVYEPAVLEDGVFVGPAAVLTNDEYPRAVTPDGRPQARRGLAAGGGDASEGASIGARRCASRRSPSAAGRWWPPVRW